MLSGCGGSGVVATPMPRYYVTIAVPGEAARLTSPPVMVHDSRDGAVTGSTAMPTTAPGFGADITGAADDRTFVVGAPEVGADGKATYHLFRLQLSARGTPGRLTELRGLAIALGNGWVTGIALSPDGSKLAVAIQGSVPRAPIFRPFAVIDVVDLRTRQTRSWRSSQTGYWAGAPSWTAHDTTLAFPWWHEAYNVMIGVDGVIVGFGQLNTADRHAPLPGPLIAPPVSGLRSVVFAAGSTLGVAAACQESARGTVGAISAWTGEISRADPGRFQVFHTETDHFIDSRTAAVLGSSCAVLSVDPSGQHALVIDGNHFTGPGT